MPRWFAYLRLCRIGNVFTALADIMMGYMVAASPFQVGFRSPSFVGGLVSLLVASAALYTAGMVWNDYFDVEQDRRERPDRPLPSGAVSLRAAFSLGVGLVLVGNLAALVAGRVVLVGTWLPSVIAMVLTGMILAYDGLLKSTWLGPVAMGGCRVLNVLLGMSLVEGGVGSWSAGHWAIALGLGVYVMGVTLFARSEASGGTRGGLMAGVAIMSVGIVVLGSFHRLLPAELRDRIPQEWVWWGLLALVAFPVLRHAAFAVAHPRPVVIQRAVGVAILTVIVLDASICLIVVGRVPAVATIALLAPALLVTRWIPPT